MYILIILTEVVVLVYFLGKNEFAENEFKKDMKSAKESKPKGDQKKSIKVPALNRVLLPNCIGIDIHNVKYVVDPYNEVGEKEPENPSQKFKTLLEKYEPFTLRWDGVFGTSHLPSQAEWEHVLNNCSAFIFSGMAKFFSHIFLDRLVAMNIPECQLMILSELVHSKPSFVRVRDLDEDKSSQRLSLETPTETVIILSLIGVHSVIANQWYTTLEENATRLEILCENLIKIGKTTGQAVHILQRSKIAMDKSSKVELDHTDSPEEKKEDPRESPCELNQPSIHPSVFNTVLYGLPNMMFM
uniref:MutS-like protein n=1 Tax=Salvator merianae TaxID=96440 RepID=A0A8D0C3W0_SALMN